MKKRVLCLLTALLLCCSMTTFVFAESPIEITCLDDFYLLAENPNGHFVLTSDIRGIAAIGTVPEFNGTLDGQGYTVENLAVYTSSNNITALIEENNGTIQNIHFTNVNMQTELSGEVTQGIAYTAAIVGKNKGIIERCSVEGRLNSTVSGAMFQSFVGGIAAYNSGIIRNCYARCTINAANNSATVICAGGLVGRNEGGTNKDGTVSHSVSIASVRANSEVANDALYYGACVGHNWSGHVTDVYTHSTCGDPIGKQQVQHTTDSYTILDSVQILSQHSYPALDFTNIWTMGNACAELRKAAHVHAGGTATCSRLAICSTCFTEYGSFAPCVYDTAWVAINSREHAHLCKNCGLYDRSYDHTANAYGFCTACDYDTGKRQKMPFTDVKASDYFCTPVLWAVTKNVTSGVSASSFAPDDSCTRGQVVTFLWRAAGSPAPKSSKNPFTDVKKSDYYYKAVLWAVENNVTTGTGKTTFSPNDTCTRGQIVTFLWRAQGSDKVSAANPFKDVKKSDYYYSAVLWAVKNNVTTGTSSVAFSPADTCTRGQVVTFLYRTIVK